MSDALHRTTATSFPEGRPRAAAVPPAALPSTQITGTAGDDTLTGGAGAELLSGLAGNCTLKGGGGEDTLQGGSGDDALFSGPGNDTLDGGEGYDLLYFTDATAGVVIDLRAATGTATGGAGTDTITGVELVFGSSFNDTYFANDAGGSFLGGDGNDTITGGAGRDHLEGNAGNDMIDGRGGVDRVAFYSAAGPVVVDLTAGVASGGLGNDTLLNIESATGSVFGDTLKGSAADNVLEGSDGNDTLISTSGIDVLDGGAGIDTAVYGLARTAYTLRPANGAGTRQVEKPFASGTDDLAGIERLRFTDANVALDIAGDGHAGQTAKLLGAVFGAGAVTNTAYAGIGLSLLDSGMGYEALAALALQAAGKSSHADVVALLWTNLVGSAPTAADAAPFVAMLDGGMAPGALAVMAADLALNAANIGLAGLAESGLAFTPWVEAGL